MIRLTAVLVATLGLWSVVAGLTAPPASGAASTVSSPALDGAAAPKVRAVTVAESSPAALTVPPSLDRAPKGYRRTGAQVARIADRVPKIRAALKGRTDVSARSYLVGPPRARRWQVSFFARTGGPEQENEEVGQVLVDDSTGRVTEAWTGPQVSWTMARGYPGAFGRAVNAPPVWLGFCLAFALPFARRPLRLLHLDVAVLLAFSVSYAFFGATDLGVSVPLVYPLLGYLLIRLIGMAVARSRGWSPEVRSPLRLALSHRTLAVGVVVLVVLRVGFNLLNSNVIDVGYSGVIGADRVLHGELPYGSFPPDNARGDTYGPVVYYAYVPFVSIFGWSGRWDDLPAAHGAAVAFDLACTLLMFLVGRRIRGPRLGMLLAYAWAAYPFTLLVTASNANDALVAALGLLGLLFIGGPARRGAILALAALSKFAPLALMPLTATYRGGGRAGEWSQSRHAAATAAVTLVAAAVVAGALLAPVLLAGRLELFADRTLGFQAGRGSPFSIWGLFDLEGLRTLVTLAAGALAVAVAFVPRRRDVIVVAALGAAVLIAVQLSLPHWFYLYIVWFFPLLLVALLAPHAEPEQNPDRSGREDRDLPSVGASS